jgi:site-specific DNA-methyltransferase (adenine-specific)
MSIKDLIPYENNPRINDDAVNDVIASIEQCENLDPIEIDEDNVILSGHTRLKALKKLKYKETEVLQITGLTDEQKRKYRILANKTGERAEWDLNKLEIELADLDFEGYDFDFDGIEIESNEPAEVVEDDYNEEPPADPKAKLGDIYQLGSHRLICGDSTDSAVIDRLMDGVKADCVFTDPPYQLDTQGGGILKSANSMKQIKQNGVDSFDPSRLTMWSDTNIFCHNKPLIKAYIELAENNNMPYDLAFYKKKNTVPNYKGHLMTDVEYIAIIGKQDPNKGLDKEMYSKCFIGQKDNDNELSYSKPVALCAKYIQLYSKKTVLDLFGGSGSTLIACEQLNRKCYMCELDPHYVDVIISRWEQYTGKKAMKIND